MEWREDFRRNGQEAPGPYKPQYRALILEKLLYAQKEAQLTEPDIDLITNQELVAVQIMWYKDSIFNYQVSEIYNKVYNTNAMKADKIDIQKKKETEILSSSCNKNPEHIQLISDLLNVQKTKILLRNKVGLSGDLERQLERFLTPKKKKETVDAN